MRRGTLRQGAALGMARGAAGPARGCSGTTTAPPASGIAGCIGAPTGRPGGGAGAPAPLEAQGARPPRGWTEAGWGTGLARLDPAAGRPTGTACRPRRSAGQRPGPRLAAACGSRATAGCSEAVARFRGGGGAVAAALTGALGSGAGGPGGGAAAARTGSGGGSAVRATGPGWAAAAGSPATSKMAAARLEGLRSPRPEAIKPVGACGFSPPGAAGGNGAALAAGGLSLARGGGACWMRARAAARNSSAEVASETSAIAGAAAVSDAIARCSACAGVAALPAPDPGAQGGRPSGGEVLARACVLARWRARIAPSKVIPRALSRPAAALLPSPTMAANTMAPSI